MSFVPSIRECMLQLEAFGDTPSIALDLKVLNREMWGDEGCSELNAAQPRLVALYKLAQDLVANLRIAGTPPADPPKPPRKPAASIGATPRERLPIGDFRPAKPLAVIARSAAPRKPNPPQPAVQPAGTWTMVQMIDALDRSEPWIYKQMLHHGFPRPSGRHGVRKLWSQQAVHAWAELQLAGSRQALESLRQRIRDAVAA